MDRDLSDTARAVARLIAEGYRRMTPERRLELAGEMSEALDELVLAGLRARHPGAGEAELMRRLAEIRLGRELASAAANAAAADAPARGE